MARKSANKSLTVGNEVARNLVPDLQLVEDAFAASSHEVLPMLLRVSFLAFPAVSSLAFKAFRATTSTPPTRRPASVMSADYGITCVDAAGDETAEYARIRGIALVAAIPVMLPICYSALLFKVRKAEWTEERRRSRRWWASSPASTTRSSSFGSWWRCARSSCWWA